jgi:hypothetical protein
MDTCFLFFFLVGKRTEKNGRDVFNSAKNIKILNLELFYVMHFIGPSKKLVKIGKSKYKFPTEKVLE